MADDYVPVRLSHLLRHCSVGAIVRGADSLMVVPDIRSWDPPEVDPRQREIRYVDQVRRALGIRQALCTPPVATERDGTCSAGYRPGSFRSGRAACRADCCIAGRGSATPRRSATSTSPAATGGRGFRPQRVRGGGRGEGVRHDECACGGRLEQMPWVLAHEEGYLADPPGTTWPTRVPARRRSGAVAPTGSGPTWGRLFRARGGSRTADGDARGGCWPPSVAFRRVISEQTLRTASLRLSPRRGSRRRPSNPARRWRGRRLACCESGPRRSAGRQQPRSPPTRRVRRDGRASKTPP